MGSESIEIWLPNEEKTLFFGASLGKTIYSTPLTILLSGEVGSGKTTLMKGLAQGLGISEDISSPTFALEQRYHTSREKELLHLDLYRLSAEEAKSFLISTEDFQGIRCIEWPEKAVDHAWHGHRMKIHMREREDGRMCHVHFEDITIPDDATIEAWREDVQLPQHIIQHCEAVATVAMKLSASLIDQGIAVRPLALRAAARTHDLLRFLDFHEGAGHEAPDHSEEQEMRWHELRARYPHRHEEACAKFLQEHGYLEIANIVKTHGVHLSPDAHGTVEQKLLYYCDKRAMGDKIVSIEERFEDFAKRYGKGTMTPEAEQWLNGTKATERELFPEGAPL